MTKIYMLLDCSDEYSDINWAVVWLNQQTIDRIHQTLDRIQGEENTVAQVITFDPFGGIAAYREGTDSLRELEDFVTRRTEAAYKLKDLEEEGRAYLLTGDELNAMVQEEHELRLECVHLEVYREGTVRVQFCERHVDRDHRTFGLTVKHLPRSLSSPPKPLTMLDISTAHMPDENPPFMGMTVKTDYDMNWDACREFVVLVKGGCTEDELNEWVPEWLRPIHDYAVEHGYFALWFSPDGDTFDAFKEYSW